MNHLAEVLITEGGILVFSPLSQYQDSWRNVSISVEVGLYDTKYMYQHLVYQHLVITIIVQ